MGKEKRKHDVEELREVLSVVSKEVPSLIKGLRASVFSEEAGRDMGKGVAAMYKELREAGIPEQTALKMVESYISTFANIGNIMTKAMSRGKPGETEKIEEDIHKKIEEDIHKKIREKMSEEPEEK
ncbi:MAG: hypothetical protein DRO11_08110 [Methanobacteriota archaeon]|nr:MAG: hypothetical protein DRO11_08110 [Euryarchaeota archaeon]